MSNENSSSSSGIGGIVFSIIAFWVLYYTVINPTLWGMASSVMPPFDILAKALIAVFAIIGAVEAIVLTVLITGGVITALFGLAVVVSGAVTK